MMAEALPAVRTKVVKTAELADALPLSSRRFTREERAEQLRLRFNSIRQRYRF
jgi:hypothetical protein